MNIYEIVITETLRRFDTKQKVVPIKKVLPILVAADTAKQATAKIKGAFTDKRFTLSKPNCIINNK